MTRDKIRELIARGLEYGDDYSVDDVLKEVFSNKADIWIGEDSVAVTTLLQLPQATRFNIWVAAGDMDELVSEMHPVFEARARDAGCKRMVITGRRGWVRAMKDLGYREVATVVAKELS